jgi:tRNA uridine 5-carboxymethylaminomethyl modification enzyme
MHVFPKHYDVIVVGGGHAGVEAALAASRIGCQTLLLTTNPDTIGQMSCNPAIGGLAKGHLAREIDAMGGEMGIATDMTGIHFRMLNTRKGPAVQAPRAQCDKKAYQTRLKLVCERQERLDVRLASVTEIVSSDQICSGVMTDSGVRFLGKCVVITTGTFLRGLLHMGSNQKSGGRSGETASIGLTASLESIGLKSGRLKTGTPPRLQRRSIDYSKLEVQPSDDPPSWFSHWIGEMFHMEQKEGAFPPGSVLARHGFHECHITRTTARTAELILQNIHLSPMYSGAIEGVGPRYCPSIEDKIVRFSDKECHQIFLEPEGVETEEVYVNGFSTCLPISVQYQLVRTIVGCENAEIVRPAYAVEYDFFFPSQLNHSLETKVCRGLFLAGQVNGTSGYEEAAAQGLMAGINAARTALGMEVITLGRDQAYIGVLIDDLITKDTFEPYRMFTSRAEHRLLLRQDNADIRLSGVAHKLGLLNEQRHNRVINKTEQIHNEISRLGRTRVGGCSLEQLLRRPEINYADLPDRDLKLSAEVIAQVEVSLKYQGYIERQAVEVQKLRHAESKQIPPNLDFNRIVGLRTEAKQKLHSIRPATIGQASRISGVSPSDISVLMVWMRNTAVTSHKENVED